MVGDGKQKIPDHAGNRTPVFHPEDSRSTDCLILSPAFIKVNSIQYETSCTGNLQITQQFSVKEEEINWCLW
jgi:hypothetical protein